MNTVYRRSRSCIEIDITYRCNLRCPRCNRSCSQAPEDLSISPYRVRDFVDQSIDRKKHWKHIAVVGGEPLLHPQVIDILHELLRYKESYSTTITVATSGYGEDVKSVLPKIPKGINILNSGKTGPLHPYFTRFNAAPIDDPRFAQANYSYGCRICATCGIGLTPLGYYPCAIAGGIDRIMGLHIGLPDIPDDGDDMEDMLKTFCAFCGHFKEGRVPLIEEEDVSPSWKELYSRWAKNRGRNNPNEPIATGIDARAS